MKSLQLACSDCELMDKNATYTTALDEVQQTTIAKIELCPVHLTPDFTSPSPELASPLPDLTSTPLKLEPSAPRFAQSLSWTVDSLTTDINPLYVLFSPPH